MNEAYLIGLTILIAYAVVLTFHAIFNKPRRDYAAQDRDRSLAKLFEARAEVLKIEVRERRSVLADQVALRREQVCADVRDARGGESS